MNTLEPGAIRAMAAQKLRGKYRAQWKNEVSRILNAYTNGLLATSKPRWADYASLGMAAFDAAQQQFADERNAAWMGYRVALAALFARLYQEQESQT